MEVRATIVVLLMATLPAVLSLPWEEWRHTEMLEPQSLPVEIGEEIKQADSQSVGTFSGCYSDTDARILDKSGPMTESDENINADCEMTCKEKGYTIASTRGRNCYCTNSLPLPLLYHANDSRASGNSGPCSMTCPGAWTEENCQDDECCGGENAYSVFIVSRSQHMLLNEAALTRVKAEAEAPKHFQTADIQAIGKFDGCYSDKAAKVLGGASGLAFKWNNNYNAKCQLMCQEKGYAIASTNGSYCYCTYSLPLPQLYRADSKFAAGNGGPCSTVCPGVATTTSCHGDECCGGRNATSVYIVGSIDALKQLERRVIDKVMQSERARKKARGSQKLIGNTTLSFHFKDQWKVHSQGNNCPYKSEKLITSGQVSSRRHSQSSSNSTGGRWSYILKTFKVDMGRNCTFKRLRVTAYYNTSTYLFRLNSYVIYHRLYNKEGSYAYNNYVRTPVVQEESGRSKIVIDVSIPKDTVPSRVADLNFLTSGNYISSGPGSPCNNYYIPAEITLEAWGHCPLVEFGVSVVAMGLSATKNGLGNVKVYNLTRINKQETLTEIPRSKSPLKGVEKTELKLKAMEKLLESSLLAKEEAFTDWDIACDNYHGSGELTCKKDYTETSSFEESWTTEHGFDLSVTVAAEFQTGVFFAKATTKFEVTAGYSFSKAYTNTKSKQYSSTFGIEGKVPKGAKMEVRFFKSDTPVQVKWRASIFADGYVLVKLHHPVTGASVIEKPTKLHLSEILSHSERTLFAFGTINYGKRSTLIARTKVVDRSGRVLSTEEKKNTPVPKVI